MFFKIVLASVIATAFFACDKNDEGGGVVKPTVAFEDYLGTYSFSATIRDRDTGEVSTIAYTDQLVAYEYEEGKVGAVFTNAIDEYKRYGSAANILLMWDEATGTMNYSPFAFIIPYGGIYISFVGCVFPDSGEYAGQPGLIPEFKVWLDKETGQLNFPKEFSHPEIGTCPAYYATWMFDVKSNMPAGCWSQAYMTDIVATKL
jgi:hypothetical protein